MTIDPNTATHRPRVGLVLGAGGAVGTAYHAGVLLALHHHLGWDARTADLVVGTSAGSIVAALLRAGVSADDVAAWCAQVAPSDRGELARTLLDELDATGPRVTGVPLPNVAWGAMLAGLIRPSEFRLTTALATLLPHGVLDADTALRRVGELLPSGQAAEPLWINAVRLATGRRTTFGRDVNAAVGDAVAASCAIPGLFRPVRVDGRAYIDGAVHSPTNADLLAGEGFDVVMVSSPMSGTGRRRSDTLMRNHHGRLLRSECAALHASGVRVEVFEPDADVLAAMGNNGLDRSRTPAVVREAFLSAGDQLARSPLAGLLRELGGGRASWLAA